MICPNDTNKVCGMSPTASAPAMIIPEDTSNLYLIYTKYNIIHTGQSATNPQDIYVSMSSELGDSYTNEIRVTCNCWVYDN